VSFRSVPKVEKEEEKKLRDILRNLIASNDDVDAAKESIFDVCVYLPQFWNYALHWARRHKCVELRDWLQRKYGAYLRWAKTRVDSIVWKDEEVRTLFYKDYRGKRVYLHPFTCVDEVVRKRQFRMGFASLAKKMRHNPTQAEIAMWEILKARSLGFEFRRQQPLLGRVPDFYCKELRLIVEVDGSSHKGRERTDYRTNRKYVAHGYNVIRFTNGQVIYCAKRVKRILEEFMQRLSQQQGKPQEGLLLLPAFREEVNINSFALERT
jgi:very-short-patch-repair endonuclease